MTGAMVPTGTGSYRFDGNASGIQHYNPATRQWQDQAGARGGASLIDPATGALVSTATPQGKALAEARRKKAAQWAQNAQAAEMEGVNAQEVEDRIAENKDRNSQINALAMSQAGNGLIGGGAGNPGGALGRGVFQRRQGGTAPMQALTELNSANAAALAGARRKALAAQQKANVAYQNPMLGYAGALNQITSQIKPSLGSMTGLA